MDERRAIADRRQSPRTGRRSTDSELTRLDEYAVETRREVQRLRAVIEGLIDVVQALTASRPNPS